MPQPISVVVPLLNEAPTLRELHRQLSEMAEASDHALQIVFVDDGSTDGSWRVIRELATEDPRVIGIRFRRNFGKAAALSAGFEAAEAPIVVTMDADLQDDPAEVPNLLDPLEEEDPETGQPRFDVVSGWKTDRKDPWHKRWPSLIFNWLVSRMTGVHLHDHNCGLKAYRREALDEVRLYGELHRFVPVLAAARGYKATEVAVHHRPREFGKSKYGVSRIIKGLMDLIAVKFLTGYGERPQHILGSIGLVSFVAGGAVLVLLAAKWVITRVAPGLEPAHLHASAALYYALALCLVGSQFLSVSLLGAMLAAYASSENASYSVAEIASGGIQGDAPGDGQQREAS